MILGEQKYDEIVHSLRPSRYVKRTVHHTEGNSEEAKEICGGIDVEADKIRATLRVSKYMKDTRVERSMCITETSGYDWDGELDEDSKCHGMESYKFECFL